MSQRATLHVDVGIRARRQQDQSCLTLARQLSLLLSRLLHRRGRIHLGISLLRCTALHAISNLCKSAPYRVQECRVSPTAQKPERLQPILDCLRFSKQQYPYPISMVREAEGAQLPARLLEERLENCPVPLRDSHDSVTKVSQLFRVPMKADHWALAAWPSSFSAAHTSRSFLLLTRSTR